MTCLEEDLVVDDVDVGRVGVVDVESFRWLGGAERDAALMDVEREVRRLQGLQAAMIAEVRRSGSFVDDFHRDVTSWTQAVLEQFAPDRTAQGGRWR